MAHLQDLASMQRMDVKEKASWIEALTAIIGYEVEMPNKYEIFDGYSGRPVFYAVEKTGCCTRQIKSCCPDCAPWDVEVVHLPSSQIAYRYERPFSLTCCCFNRPEVQVYDVMQGRKIGSLRDPFACCDLTITLRDANDYEAIDAKGGCCQWGLCCPLPCGPCSEVAFPLQDSKSGQDVGVISKKVPSCLKFLFASDVDNYHIDFGGIQNPDYKALVMALSIFIDFRWFSDNRNDDEGGIMGMMTDGE